MGAISESFPHLGHSDISASFFIAKGFYDIKLAFMELTHTTIFSFCEIVLLLNAEESKQRDFLLLFLYFILSSTGCRSHVHHCTLAQVQMEATLPPVGHIIAHNWGISPYELDPGTTDNEQFVR